MNWAQILNVNNIVINIVSSDSLPVEEGYTFIQVEGVTCTDGEPVNPGCTFIDGEFIDIPLDAYGRSVTMTNDGTNDYYTVTDPYANNTFEVTVAQDAQQSVAYDEINDTQIPTLAEVQAYTIEQFVAAGLSYLNGAFSLQTQFNLILMWQSAINNDFQAVSSYIQPFVTFMFTLFQYQGVILNQINNQSTIAGVLAVDYNWSSITIPNINPQTAATILSS